MANCDMCGQNSENYIAEIEGTKMNVCKGCAEFGKVITKIEPEIEQVQQTFNNRSVIDTEPEMIESIIEDYPRIIKNKRENLGMTQKAFAKFISEKESLLHHIETGKSGPSMQLAKKLEKILKIKLIEEIEDTPLEIKDNANEESEGFTLGDFIKKKR